MQHFILEYPLPQNTVGCESSHRITSLTSGVKGNILLQPAPQLRYMPYYWPRTQNQTPTHIKSAAKLAIHAEL